MTRLLSPSSLVRSTVAGLALLALAACGEVHPLDTEVAVEGSDLTPMLSVGQGSRQILMLDACDPASFNEFFGIEICTPTSPRAGIPFSTFVADLERKQRVDAWRFSPSVIRVTRAVTFRVPNLGGIPHSFTEVEEFGGGFVPLLNELSGNLDPAPECVHPQNPMAPHPDVDLIAPGDEGVVTIEPGAEKKYMCCIHPWMRAVSS